jgi:O-antigen biosynthesis protein
MIPVLIVSGVKGDTRRYRAFHLYEQLGIAGLDCTLSHITEPDIVRLAERARVAVFQRVTYDGRACQCLDAVRQGGGKVISDVDDLVFDPEMFRWIDSPDFSDPLRARLYRENMRRNRLTLESSDTILVSTGFLSQQVEQLGKPVRIHRNAFSLEMGSLSETAYREKRKDREKIVIGYASGTPTHDHDFALVRPVLMEVMRRFPRVELWLVGPLDPGDGWGGLEGRLHRQGLVPWRELPSLLACFDINLAPLVAGNPFSQSKSEIKYMEAGLVGVPTVASPVEAFSFAIRSGENGYLAVNDREWQAALERLIADPQARREMGEQARQEVLEGYAPQDRAASLVKILSELDALPDEKPCDGLEIGNLRKVETAEMEKRPGNLQMALYSLRWRGVSTLLIQVWVFIRRLLAPFFPFR